MNQMIGSQLHLWQQCLLEVNISPPEANVWSGGSDISVSNVDPEKE